MTFHDSSMCTFYLNKGAMQPGQSFPATTGTAPIYPHGFSSPNQQPVAGNPIPAHVNGPPADQQHSIMTSGPGKP